MARRHHVVVVGGGFAGLTLARRLTDEAFGITLVDRRNFHLFQPLLYQVATGGLSPANIATPLRAVLARRRNCRVWLAEMTALDAAARRIRLDSGELAYDTLVLATGASHNYFDHPQWEPLAPGLKTIEDATDIRGRILLQFEAAELATDPEEVRARLTFVVVGAGPTGVELAGTLAEMSRHTLRRDFRRIDPARATVLLVEAGSAVLPTYPGDLSRKARTALERLGVTVRLDTSVVDVAPDRVCLRSGESTEEVPTRVVLWAAGVQASPVGQMLVAATGAELDPAGRVVVGPDLAVPGHPHIFVLGDLALCRAAGGRPLPGIAPVAIQQGAYVARLLAARRGGRSLPPFRYVDRGTMATIGRAAAVADLGRLRLSGRPAWLAWLLVHILSLIEAQSRVLVLTQWAWNYFTWGRSARLITGEGRGVRGPR